MSTISEDGIPAYSCSLCIAHAIQSRDIDKLEQLLMRSLPFRDSFLVLTPQCIARETDLESLIPRVPDPTESDGSNDTSCSPSDNACGHRIIDPELVDPRALDWRPGAPFLVNMVQLAVHMSDSQFDALTPLCRSAPELANELLAFHEIRPVDELIEFQGGTLPGVLIAQLRKDGVYRRVRVTTKLTNLVGLLASRRPLDSLIVSRLCDEDLIDMNSQIQCINMRKSEDQTDDHSGDDTFQQSVSSEDVSSINGVVTGREVSVLLDMSQQMLSNSTSSNHLHTIADRLQTLISLGCDINGPLDEMLFYVSPQQKYHIFIIYFSDKI